MGDSTDSAKHPFDYWRDAGWSLSQLADAEDAWNQSWHVPTAADPPTGQEFIGLAAKEFGVHPKYRVINRPTFRLAGLFDTATRELYEMLYQYEFDYLFDSTKFNSRFQFQPTSYADGIQRVAQDYHLQSSTHGTYTH